MSPTVSTVNHGGEKEEVDSCQEFNFHNCRVRRRNRHTRSARRISRLTRLGLSFSPCFGWDEAAGLTVPITVLTLSRSAFARSHLATDAVNQYRMPEQFSFTFERLAETFSNFD